ncbi:MAG: transposase [Coriobacteriales bacterium]
MYLKTPVAVPDEPGKIVFTRKKGSVYVYLETGRTYDPARKFTIPRRVTIGKLVDPGDRSRMYPNENYAKHYPLEVPEEREGSMRSSCLRIGTYAVMSRIAADCGLPAMLSDVLGERDGALMLDLAFYSVVTEGNAAQHYPAYAYSHPLATLGMRMYSDSKVSELLRSVGEREACVPFLNRWSEGRDHREKVWISYDSTNKDCQAGDISMVETGRTKDNLTGPVFNVAVAYDRSNSVPLFYEEYPGSIVDVSQLQLMLEKARSYGYRHCGFILDRGYFSRDNIAYMDRCGYSFVMMVKGMAKLVSSVVEEVRGTFESDRDRCVRRYHAYGTTVVRPLYASDERPRWIHVYYSAGRVAREREAIESNLDKAARLMRKMVGKEWTMPDSYSRYYEACYDDEGCFMCARERKDAISRELELAGYFAIVTSDEMTAEEALTLYKARDASEKLFCGSKSFLGGRALRVHSDESASGKLLAEFVALIMRNRMHVLLAERAAAGSTKANCLTVPAAIRELEKIEVVRQADGVYRLDHAVTATQREVLAAFGMDADTIKGVADEIGSQLQENGKEI